MENHIAAERYPVPGEITTTRARFGALAGIVYNSPIMPLDPSILELLVCPENHLPLAIAPAEVLDPINMRIAAGQVITHGGKAVDALLTEGLLRQDGACLYRVDDSIPNLLIEDRIDL